MARDSVATGARALLALLALGTAAGCAAPTTRYAWGQYEQLIYVAEVRPGQLPPEAQIDQLQKDRQLAEAAHRPLPPGWHAHLGTLYFDIGRADLAREELLAEKTAFPESATLVDRLLSRLAPKDAAAP